MQLTSIRNWLRLDTFRGRLPDEEEDQGLSERPDEGWVKPKAATHKSAFAPRPPLGRAGSPDCEETMNMGFVFVDPSGQKPHLKRSENACYVDTKLAWFWRFSRGTTRRRGGP